VTRWDAFRPIGCLFAMGSFLKITEVAHILGDFCPRTRFQFWRKMGWPKFWAIFSQTHLVTLATSCPAESHTSFIMFYFGLGKHLRLFQVYTYVCTLRSVTKYTWKNKVFGE
jgi:hypothetical protein